MVWLFSGPTEMAQPRNLKLHLMLICPLDFNLDKTYCTRLIKYFLALIKQPALQTTFNVIETWTILFTESTFYHLKKNHLVLIVVSGTRKNKNRLLVNSESSSVKFYLFFVNSIKYIITLYLKNQHAFTTGKLLVS